ncbi:MAG: response regulator transcription factor [Dehalococcoidia bacterium]
MHDQGEGNSQTAAKRVLVVDDDRNHRAAVCAILELGGYSVVPAQEGREALRKFFAEPTDLVILDVTMPGMDGWTLLERIREVSDVPVIMLTALEQEQYKVQGLRGGADDYVTKPFGRQELLARVETQLRRVPNTAEVTDRYEDPVLRIDFRTHQVHVRAQSVHLSALEFRLLTALVRNPSAVLSADRLLDLCWTNRETGPETVRVFIGNLRKKLEEDPARPQLIETIREFGYRYRPPEARS